MEIASVSTEQTAIEQAQVENVIAHIEADTAITEASALAQIATAEAETAIAEAVAESAISPVPATGTDEDYAWLLERLDGQDLMLRELQVQLSETKTSLLAATENLTKLLEMVGAMAIVNSSTPPISAPNPEPTPEPIVVPAEGVAVPVAASTESEPRKRQRRKI